MEGGFKSLNPPLLRVTAPANRLHGLAATVFAQKVRAFCVSNDTAYCRTEQKFSSLFCTMSNI